MLGAGQTFQHRDLRDVLPAPIARKLLQQFTSAPQCGDIVFQRRALGSPSTLRLSEFASQRKPLLPTLLAQGPLLPDVRLAHLECLPLLRRGEYGFVVASTAAQRQILVVRTGELGRQRLAALPRPVPCSAQSSWLALTLPFSSSTHLRITTTGQVARSRPSRRAGRWIGPIDAPVLDQDL